jgi:hypothetical protein
MEPNASVLHDDDYGGGGGGGDDGGGGGDGDYLDESWVQD